MASSVDVSLAADRKAGKLALRARLQRARREGDLASHLNPDELARYIMSLSEGLVVHAAAGATRRDLNRVVDIALLVLQESDT